MESKNIFSGGKMNRDADERLIQQGEYRYALNAKVLNSSTSGVGALENSLSNEEVTIGLNFGPNPVCIGSIAHDGLNKVWWFVRSDDGSYIAEYDFDNSLESIVLADKQSGNGNTLNFSKSNYITADVLYDNDNDSIMLFFTDGINQPKKIDVEKCKLLGTNDDINGGSSFREDMITVIKKPPLYPPSLSLSTTPSAKENNIKEKFISFAYRWKYEGGEYSTLSPFSEVAFKPFNFNFDYNIQSNESMLNSFNKADIEVQTGPDEVVAVDLVFKVYGDTTVYLVESYDKEKKNISSNTTHTIGFDNSKIYDLLDPRELNRYYDNVPLTARTQALVGNRIMYSNYTENFDLIDANGDTINVDFTPSIYTKGNPNTGNAYTTIKTNRDYEIGIVYLDDFGRSTTVLTSDTNSVYVDPSYSKSETGLKVNINNLPPKFASKYRFFVKQTKQNYYNILPAVFRVDDDTGFVYILLNATDVNKVKEDDFLVVKADTGGAKSTLVETKVLEVAQKDTNFLEDANYPQAGDPPIAQPPGTYMKIKPVGFRMTLDDYDLYENSDLDTTGNDRDDPLAGYGSLPAKATGPFYYGTTSALNDLTISGTYNGTPYARLTVTIATTGDGVSTVDTFNWAVDFMDDGVTGGQSSTAVAIDTINGNVLGSTGITLQFAADTGHDTNDKWTSTLKPANPSYPRNSKAFSTFKGLPVVEEAIRAGTIINLEYDEYNEATQYWTYEFTASGNYANLEEWYFESNAKAIFDAEFGESRVFFERGVYGGTSTALESQRANTEPLHLIIRSLGTQNNDFDARAKIGNKTRIVKRASTDELCFETKPVEDTTELYYEIPKTYEITEGYHIGIPASVGQTPQVTKTLSQGTTNLTVANTIGYTNYDNFPDSDNWDNFTNLSSNLFTNPPNYRIQIALDTDSYTAFGNYFDGGNPPNNGGFGNGNGKELKISQGGNTISIAVQYYQRYDISGGTRITLFNNNPSGGDMDASNYISGSGSFSNSGGDFTVSFGDVVDVSQTANNAAEITLPFYNAWGFANAVESNSIRDVFNAPVYKLDTKPLTNLKEYKKSFRTTSITWSGLYEQSTQFNALNDFSLADLNYKDLDDEYGDIAKIVPRGSDIIVFQENRVSRVLVNKSVLFNSDGSGNVGKSTDILGTTVPYAGEFGVSRHPFSVVLWGGRVYFVDERRGAVCRLSQDGIEQISDFGMVDYFRDSLKGKDPYRVIGAYDPHDREYVISLQGSYTEWRPDKITCEIIYDDDAPPTSTTSTTSTSSTTTSSTTLQPTTSSTTFFF